MKHHVGELIRRKRKELGLTLQDIAGPTLSVPTISNIERGITRNVSQKKLDYILHKLGINLAELLDVEQEESELEDFFTVKLNQVNALILNNCFDEADERLKALEQEVKKMSNAVHTCRLSLYRGKLFMYEKKFDRAEWEFHNVIRRCEEFDVPSDSNLVSEAYGNLGYIAYHQGNYNNAIKHTNKALHTFEATGERRYLKGRQLYNLALFYESMGKANKAYGLTSQALAIAKENGDYSSMINVYILKSIIQQNYFNINDALESLKEAQKFLHLTNDPKLTGIVWNNLGENYFLLGNYDMAELCFETSVAIKQKHLEDEFLIRSYMFLGQICAKRGNYSQAKTYLHEAIALSKKAGNQKYLVESLLSLTKVYLTCKETDNAKDVLETAYSFAKRHSFTKELREATVWLAQLYEKSDKEKFRKYTDELYTIEKESLLEGGIV
ncbi:helix-turn-helix domain-containing protein [Numidum massiliense]|uniref:helix-turn-helix domain-containing protein n=1 Tax=Numidum massiliense TaxID=1522315 RepID=UPI0006D59FCF|nr:helix-turn-helix transcriptional regulator [Numidum massiliense]